MNKMKDIYSFTSFKPIRNQIGNYDPVELAIAISAKLHEIENKPVNQLEGWLPWYLLALLKWGFEFGGNRFPCDPITEGTLAKLINKIREFDGDCGSPFLLKTGLSKPIKFFRTLQVQQFWFQLQINTWGFARQYLLFCNYSKNHLIQSLFSTTHNISIFEFIEISLLFWCWQVKDVNVFSFNLHEALKTTKLSTNILDKYIKLLSLEEKDVKEFLTLNPKLLQDPSFQLTSQSPFITKPFLKIENRILVYSRKLFEKTINDFLYDQVKSLGGSKAAEQFSKALENYVFSALSSLNIPFRNEKMLQKQFPGSKVTDCIIDLQECTIMLEIKSQEIRPIVQVYPENYPLINELQDSVIKATIQGYILADKIIKDREQKTDYQSTPLFLLILTYKDFYLGNGQIIWDEFLFTALKSELDFHEIDSKIIPADHIVVLSLSEFDLLMSCLTNPKNSLGNILATMVKNNSDSHTQKITFSQHLDNFVSKQPCLPYLDKPFEEISQKIMGCFSKCN